jgi:catechol 2,3-dioxygenase
MIGTVSLTVADPERAQAFYAQTIGLRPVPSDDGAVRLAAGGGPALVELVSDPDAPARPPATSGLFHLAILVPDRAELARSLHRAIESGWRLTGASDHLVSEALYLSDPEGNGIEIYRDRPRAEWKTVGGELAMATLPLDLDALAGEDGDQPEAPMPAGTTMGHVHLNVADLEDTESFYAGVLGFEVTVRGYPGALFVSAGGYHHHVGLNTWAGEGAPPPPEGSRGLRWFELRVPPPELDAIEGRLKDAGMEAEREDGGIRTSDPSGNGILIAAEPD